MRKEQTAGRGLGFEAEAKKNRTWYKGEPEALYRLYHQPDEGFAGDTFWAATATKGMEVRRLHTGIPAVMADALAAIAARDIGELQFESPEQQELWNAIDNENMILNQIEEILKEVLYIGDGAFKVSFDTSLSAYPIVEWYPGDQLEIRRNHGRIREIIFKTSYHQDDQQYLLCEHYGYGSITYKLYDEAGQEVPLKQVAKLGQLKAVSFDPAVILAVPLMVYQSHKWHGRGRSIFEKRTDTFDALDEIWSQWMDGVRMGRIRSYIPESLLGKNPGNGTLAKPNFLDCRFIRSEEETAIDGRDKILIDQYQVSGEDFFTSYMAVLNLCLQGILSPATLGMDIRKLGGMKLGYGDEKMTMVTKHEILRALTITIPRVVELALNGHSIFNHQEVTAVKAVLRVPANV